jgi:hypothetical protein
MLPVGFRSSTQTAPIGPAPTPSLCTLSGLGRMPRRSALSLPVAIPFKLVGRPVLAESSVPFLGYSKRDRCPVSISSATGSSIATARAAVSPIASIAV